jgi:hypothetical protein
MGPGMTALAALVFPKIVLAIYYNLHSGFYSTLDLDGTGSWISWSY